MRFLKKMIAFLLSAAAIFTVAVLVLSVFNIYVSDALIVGFYGAFACEAATSGFIKITETRQEKSDNKKLLDSESDLYKSDEGKPAMGDRTQRRDEEQADEEEAVG